MKSIYLNASSYAIAVLARLLSPALRRHLSRQLARISGELPQLGGVWAVHFENPACYGRKVRRAIDAELEQFGQFVYGTGHLHGEPGDPFEYRGFVKRNAVYGFFRRKDSNILAGTGTFVLKVSPDTQKMAGHCTWYDNPLDDVWASAYRWTKKG